MSSQSYPVVIIPTVTHTRVLLDAYPSRKFVCPFKLLLVKLMVNCCASEIWDVTCTAKSDWYLPGKRISANSLKIWVIFEAWFWLTQKTMLLPISPLSGSLSAFSIKVWQNARLVLSENSFFSKSREKNVCRS